LLKIYHKSTKASIEKKGKQMFARFRAMWHYGITDNKEGKMPKAIIIFETRKGSTEAMAETIKEGLEQSGIKVELKRVSEVELGELAGYDGVLLGSATYNKDMIGIVKTFLFRLEKVSLKGKIGASFGAYGWSGEAVGMLFETMKNIYGMEMVDPGAKLPGSTAGVERSTYLAFAQKIAEKIKQGKK
jgi:flavorubredoxin